jgi:hypothetical protein
MNVVVHFPFQITHRNIENNVKHAEVVRTGLILQVIERSDMLKNISVSSNNGPLLRFIEHCLNIRL